jgi:hypothetical protein
VLVITVQVFAFIGLCLSMAAECKLHPDFVTVLSEQSLSFI